MQQTFKFPVLALAALASGIFAQMSLGLGEKTANSFALAPGIVVDLNANRAYVMRPEGGIAAIDLAQGNELWHSMEAAKPLTVSGELLICQAEPEENSSDLKIVILNTENEGKRVLEQSVPLPLSVKPSIASSAARSFTATAEVVTDDAAVTWDYQERVVQGKRPQREVLPGEPEPSPGTLPPGALRTEQGEVVAGGPKTKTATGAFRLNLKSGAVTPQKPKLRSAPIATIGPAVELSPSKQLSGVPGPQFLSSDGKYVMSPEPATGGSPLAKYIWTIYNKDTGARVGEFRTSVRYAPFFIVGSRLVYEVGPYQRKTATGLIEEPLQIQAVDLATGETVWSEPVRDTVERAAPPP